MSIAGSWGWGDHPSCFGVQQPHDTQAPGHVSCLILRHILIHFFLSHEFSWCSFCSTDLSQTSLWSKVRDAKWSAPSRDFIQWRNNIYLWRINPLKWTILQERKIVCHILPVFSTIYTWYVCLVSLSVIGRLWRHWPNITLFEVVLNQNCISMYFQIVWKVKKKEKKHYCILICL